MRGKPDSSISLPPRYEQDLREALPGSRWGIGADSVSARPFFHPNYRAIFGIPAEFEGSGRRSAGARHRLALTMRNDILNRVTTGCNVAKIPLTSLLIQEPREAVAGRHDPQGSARQINRVFLPYGRQIIGLIPASTRRKW